MQPTTTIEKLELLARRYGQEQEGDFPWNSTISLLVQHVSVRHFLRKPLPENTLETLMAAAQSASTGSLLHSWSVVAVTDPERKSHCAYLSGNQEWVREAPLFMLFCADLGRIADASEVYNGTRNAPGLKYVDLFVMSSFDAAMAAQNATIAAESMGLKMCYCGGARNNAQELTEYLGLPDHVVGLFGMGVGYEDPSQANAMKPRIPLDGVLHRERWNEEARKANTIRYEEILQNHYKRQKKDGRKPWTEHLASFVKSDYLDGRERYRGVLDGQGFEFR